MIRITPSQLEQAAKARRRGFAAAVMAVAVREGEHIVISREAWGRLTVQYINRGITGPGDLVALVAKPIARAIDRATAKLPWPEWRTNLTGCRACNQRQTRWNDRWRAWLNR
jgi:hypothetical protein